MTYTRQPLATFRALYPQFSTLTDAAYDAWADRIEPSVTDRYGTEQQQATELMLAHTLATNGVGTGAAGSVALAGGVSFKSGDFAVQLSDAVVQQKAKGGLKSTIYGQQLADIQRRLFGGPMLVGCSSPYLP